MPINPVKLMALIFRHQDTDTLNHIINQEINAEHFAQVETRPHDEGVMMTIIIRNKENNGTFSSNEEIERQRFIIKAETI